MRPEVAVDPLRCRSPLTRSAVGKNRLQASDDVTGGPLFESRHWPTIWQGVPGQRTDDTVNHQAGTLLKLFHRCFYLGTKYAIDGDSLVGRTAQCPLQTPNYLARGARTYGWLTGIRHNFLPTLLILRACSKLKFEMSLPELFGRNSP
jgi:hypothetical protein